MENSVHFFLFPWTPDGNSLGLKGSKSKPSTIPLTTLRTRIVWCIIWLPDYSSVLVGGNLQWGFCSKSTFNIKRFVFRSLNRTEKTPVNTKEDCAFCLWFVTMGNQCSIEGLCIAQNKSNSLKISVVQTIRTWDLLYYSFCM